jgi:dTDP-4-dehydrorhamnose 3,5-epimerase
MNVETLPLPGILLIKPRIFRDDRGHFVETWRDADYQAAGLPGGFVQDNVSVSRRGTLRGLHFQHPGGQGKLVTAMAGTVFDVAVDVRRDSPTRGQWVGVELSEENGHQLWIPAGFAHGYLALSDRVVVGYKCTTYYSPADEHVIRWNDPDIGVAWPELEPVLSARDAAAPRMADCPAEVFPPFDPDVERR